MNPADVALMAAGKAARNAQPMEGPEDSMDDSGLEAASALSDALQSGDPQAILDAFKSLTEYCSTPPTPPPAM